MELPSWIKKIAGYAPDIAAAVATGGGSLAVTGLRILGKELLGSESATEQQIEEAVKNASPEQLVALTKCNNEFKVQMRTLDVQEKKNEQFDNQQSHLQTQETIRQGDNSDNKLVAMTRPLQTWACLVISAALAFMDKPSEYVFAFLGIVASYHGLRQLGKWKTASSIAKVAKDVGSR